MRTFTLNFDGGWISLAAFGYENVALKDTPDENWVKGRVSFKLPELSGTKQISFLPNDIDTFKHELENALDTLSGLAILYNTEEDIRVELAFGIRGDIQVLCQVKEINLVKYNINFSATSDQTRASTCLSEVIDFCNEFPAVRRQ